ncbi:MAG TPA: tetratricopeptide repeat protein [Deltaproteobacteria bacterium]|nr:tetratricopeptide repeat protein [Deltaproteobacteria bacterium]
MKTEKIILNDAYKGFTLDQDKIVPPDKTVERIKKKLNEIHLDILKGTLRIDNGRLNIPVYVSVCGDDAKAVTGTKKQMGKGATTNQSEASAVMELAERFSFFTFCNTPDNFVVDTYANIKDKAIPFDMIAKSVHDESEDLPHARKIFETLPLKWTRAYNLTRQQPVWIPFSWFFAINEFNGPSAGNCVEEALSQGICEIVERHVSSVISHNKLSVPAIRPESVTDTMVVEMLKKYKKAGVQLYLSDFTLDMGIPSVGAMAYDPSTFPEKSEIVWTAGTTPDPQKAFSRALTEVAQLAGDFNTGANYVASGLPKYNTMEEAAYITAVDQMKDISELPDISDDNIKVEVENCIAALSERGMEVIVVDTMHSQLEVPAFYTIIPGAHFRERAIGTSVGMFSAKLMASNDNPLDAIRDLEGFEKTLPGKYYTRFYLGTSYLALDDPEAALAYFEKSLTLNPTEEDIPSIYSYMGVCLKEMEQYEKALDRLKEGEKLDKDRTDIYNLMGFCHFKLKEHEKAIECFEQVIKLNPTSAIDYANIASNYRDMGDKATAVRYYEQALSMDPTIEFARDNLEKLRMS